MKEPSSMDECVYFTRRVLGTGKAAAWVYRKECPKCKKCLMGKPKDPKTGRYKIRATEYVCYECGYTEEKKEHMESLDINITYTCPKCSFEGEKQMPFIRKKVMRTNEETGKRQSVEAVKIECENCGEVILITKKLK